MDVPVKNIGDTPLEISVLTTSSGALRVHEFDKVVAPGGEGVIRVEIDPPDTSKGRLSATATFTSSDPLRKTFDVLFEYVFYAEDVTVVPQAVVVSGRADHKNAADLVFASAIHIVDHWTERLQIKSVVLSSPLLEYTLQETTFRDVRGESSHIFKLVVIFSRGWPVGPVNESVTFTTNHPDYPAITVPISGVIEGNVRVSPATILLGSVKPGDVLDRTIHLRSLSGPLIVSDQPCIVDHPGLDVTCRRVDDSQVDLRVSGMVVASTRPADGVEYDNKIRVQILAPDRFQQIIRIRGLFPDEVHVRNN